MFRDGNVLLCDQSHEIIQPLTHAAYAERTLKKGHTYKPPPQSPNPFEMDIKTIQKYPPVIRKIDYFDPRPTRSIGWLPRKFCRRTYG